MVLEVFCSFPPCDKLETQLSQESMDGDAAAAQVASTKLWPISNGKDVLSVYIMNPDALKKIGLNELNIMSWAEKWEYGVIPKLKLTSDKQKSDIRIKVGKC